MNPLKASDLGVTPEEIEEGYQTTFQLFRTVYPQIPDLVLDDFRLYSSIEGFKKNKLLIDYGDICRKLFIVIKGYVHINLMVDGVERPLWFVDVGQITVAVKSYFRHVPSRERQIAVEDTVCIVLDRDKYQLLYDKHPGFQKIKEYLFEEYYFEALWRIELFYLAPEARYLVLLENRRDIIMNAKISELAKYLGIARETLSRKRAELMKGEK